MVRLEQVDLTGARLTMKQVNAIFAKIASSEVERLEVLDISDNDNNNNDFNTFQHPFQMSSLSILNIRTGENRETCLA